MKTINTKIPNNESKWNYALIHVGTFQNIEEYLEDLIRIQNGVPNDTQLLDVTDIVSEISNELEAIRRI